MKDYEIKDAILKFMLKDSEIVYSNLILHMEITGRQMDGREFLAYLNILKKDGYIKETGSAKGRSRFMLLPEASLFMKNGGYTYQDYKRVLQETTDKADREKERKRGKWDRRLDRMAKVFAILFGLATIVLSILLANCK